MLLVHHLKSLDAVFMIVISDENDYIEHFINIQFSIHLLIETFKYTYIARIILI